MTYEAAKKRAEPYNKIVGELPEMRRETVDLVNKVLAEDRRAYVLVNNRSEGKCATHHSGDQRSIKIRGARADVAHGEGSAD